MSHEPQQRGDMAEPAQAPLGTVPLQEREPPVCSTVVDELLEAQLAALGGEAREPSRAARIGG